jgi:hypothetical protein
MPDDPTRREFDFTDFFAESERKLKAELEHERQHYVEYFYSGLSQEDLEIARLCLYKWLGVHVRFETKMHHIAPSTVKRLTEPVEILFTGFGCVLMKKEVNDNSSFITLEPDSANSEDSVFCQNARRHGYNLLVDPTVFCEHIDEPIILKT